LKGIAAMSAKSEMSATASDIKMLRKQAKTLRRHLRRDIYQPLREGKLMELKAKDFIMAVGLSDEILKLAARLDRALKK
jgi:hypothetical protein